MKHMDYDDKKAKRAHDEDGGQKCGLRKKMPKRHYQCVWQKKLWVRML
jgi:hypothetical protein